MTSKFLYCMPPNWLEIGDYLIIQSPSEHSLPQISFILLFQPYKRPHVKSKPCLNMKKTFTGWLGSQWIKKSVSAISTLISFIHWIRCHLSCLDRYRAIFADKRQKRLPPSQDTSEVQMAEQTENTRQYNPVYVVLSQIGSLKKQSMRSHHKSGCAVGWSNKMSRKAGNILCGNWKRSHPASLNVILSSAKRWAPGSGKFCCCCCLTLLPGLACSIHATWGPPFSRAPNT